MKWWLTKKLRKYSNIQGLDTKTETLANIEFCWFQPAPHFGWLVGWTVSPSPTQAPLVPLVCHAENWLSAKNWLPSAGMRTACSSCIAPVSTCLRLLLSGSNSHNLQIHITFCPWWYVCANSKKYIFSCNGINKIVAKEVFAVGHNRAWYLRDYRQ